MYAELRFKLYNVFLIKWQILLIKSLLAKFSQPFIQVLQTVDNEISSKQKQRCRMKKKLY